MQETTALEIWIVPRTLQPIKINARRPTSDMNIRIRQASINVMSEVYALGQPLPHPNFRL